MKRTKSTYLALLAVLLSPMVANAIPIEISGTPSSDGVWEITTVSGGFDDVLEFTAQEWWGDSALASAFSDALGLGLGTFQQGFGPFAPLFAYSTLDTVGWQSIAVSSYGGLVNITCNGSTCLNGSNGRVWAIAERVSAVPEPGTLALFGIGLLGMGAARRRKKP